MFGIQRFGGTEVHASKRGASRVARFLAGLNANENNEEADKTNDTRSPTVEEDSKFNSNEIESEEESNVEQPPAKRRKLMKNVQHSNVLQSKEQQQNEEEQVISLKDSNANQVCISLFSSLHKNFILAQKNYLILVLILRKRTRQMIHGS